MLAVFSSLIFTSDITMPGIEYTLLVVNLVLMLSGWAVAGYGIILDLYLYIRLGIFVGFAEHHGSADPNLDEFYKSVDPHGVLNIAHYDMLVLRNRYFHTVKRRRSQVEIDAGHSGYHVIEDQNQARAHFDRLLMDFACFLRRIDPKLAREKPRVIKEQRKQRRRLGRVTASATTSGADNNTDEGEYVSDLASETSETGELQFMRETGRMLQELFSPEMLAMMVLFQDHVIKQGSEFGPLKNLMEYGPLNLAEEVLQFAETFTNDACLHAGGLPWGMTELEPGFQRTVQSAAVMQAQQSVSNKEDIVPGSHTGKDVGIAEDLQLKQAMQRGRRWLVHANGIIGNNVRSFLRHRRTDWLSVDDVLAALRERASVQANNLWGSLAKRPREEVTAEAGTVSARLDNPLLDSDSDEHSQDDTSGGAQDGTE